MSPPFSTEMLVLNACNSITMWSVVAEWLGRHGICEQDTLKSTAQGSHNKK
jgi:hypothetical protein